MTRILTEPPRTLQRAGAFGVMGHTADEFSEHEWTAFWRENNERHVMTKHESIFKGTIRKLEFRDYGSYVVDSLGTHFKDHAPAGTFKVRCVEGDTSYEPTPVKLAFGWSPADAMLKALALYGGEWGIPCGIPLHP